MSAREQLLSVCRTVRKAILLAWLESDAFVRRRFFLTLVLVFGTALLAAIAPVALKYAIDGLRISPNSIEVAPYSSSSVQPWLGLSPTALIAAYVVGLGVSRFLGEARWYFFGTADQRLHRRLSGRLLRHVIDLPMAFHADRKTGGLNQILVQGLSGYRILTNHAVFTVLPVTIEIIIVGIVLSLFLDATLLSILTLAVAAYIAVFAFGASRIIGPIREVSTSQVAATANMTDSILNAETVKCFTAEHRISERYDNALAVSERWWSVFYWRKSENGVLVALVFTLSLGAAMILSVIRVRQGALSVGEFVLINAYMLQIVRPLETLGLAIRDIAYGAAFIEKMMNMMGRKPEGAAFSAIEDGGCRGFDIGRLEFCNVNFSYATEQAILDSIDFTINPGKTLGIVGQSGAGKSSLIRLLMRLYEPSNGEILLDGKNIRELPLEELRRSIAIVPQDTVLFNDSIAYNIGLGKNDASQADIERAARIAHIHDRIQRMPDGYRTTVGERGFKLSGGERQRVSIARAVLKKPKLFVFDEATSSLDSETEQGIQANLIEVSNGISTLIISHRLSVVAHADEIIVLQRGRIVERGRHNELLSDNGIYGAIWHSQLLRKAEAINEKTEIV